MEEKKPHYKRILVKLSGEALSNGEKGILNYDFLEEIGHVIKTCVDMAHRSASLSVQVTFGEEDRVLIWIVPARTIWACLLR
jgi:hypothetical protein